MPDVIKSIDVKSALGTSEVILGADIQNIDVFRDTNGDIVTGIPSSSDIRESAANTLKNIEDSIENVEHAVLWEEENVIGAKNFIPFKEGTTVRSGITFTTDKNGVITITGTSSANIEFEVPFNDIINDECKFTIDYLMGTSTTVHSLLNIRVENSSGAAISPNFAGNSDGTRELLIAANSNIKYFTISVGNGANFSTISAIVKPMLRPSVIKDRTYTSYAMTNKQLTNRINNLHTNFKDLDDVNIDFEHISNGHVPKYNLTTQKWENGEAEDNKVLQKPDTDNVNYEILFSGTADNNEHIEGAKKNNNLKFNPSTGNLQVTKINDITVPSGGAAKFTDENVKQDPIVTNANYEVLFSRSADNSTHTEGTGKNSNLKFNPSTGNLQVTKINDVTVPSGGTVKFTDENVKQDPVTDNANYEVLFSRSTDNTTHTEGAGKNSNLKFNPSTGNLQATQLNGVSIPSDGSIKFTDEKVKQTPTSTNSDYEILFSESANNDLLTEGVRKNSNLKFNPSTGNLQATQINGVTLPSSDTIKFTDENVTQNATTSNAEYEVLLSGTADNNDHTEGTKKSNGLRYNPNGDNLIIGKNNILLDQREGPFTVTDSTNASINNISRTLDLKITPDPNYNNVANYDITFPSSLTWDIRDSNLSNKFKDPNRINEELALLHNDSTVPLFEVSVILKSGFIWYASGSSKLVIGRIYSSHFTDFKENNPQQCTFRNASGSYSLRTPSGSSTNISVSVPNIENYLSCICNYIPSNNDPRFSYILQSLGESMRITARYNNATFPPTPIDSVTISTYTDSLNQLRETYYNVLPPEKTFITGNYTQGGFSIGQTAMGIYNIGKLDTLLEVGKGTSDSDRSNAFEVYRDGTLSTDNGSHKVTLESLINPQKYGCMPPGNIAEDTLQADTTGKDYTLQNSGTYLLWTWEYNPYIGVYRGHHAYYFYVYYRTSSATSPSIFRVNLGASSSSGVTITTTNESPILNIKSSSDSYYVKYILTKIN